MGQDQERKSFLEEAFEHRERATPPDGFEAENEEAISEVTSDTDDGAIAADAVDADAGPVDSSDQEPAPPQFVTLSIDEYALVDEALKKSGLVWVQTATAPAGRAVWHSWLDDAIYVLTGGTEQPDPGFIVGGVATVVVRSKDTTSRLVTVTVSVESLTPVDADWEAATAELAKTRLNLVDPAAAPTRWATDQSYRLYRLRPYGPLIEGPGVYSADSQRAAPVPTQATTAGAKPKVLHRRHGSGAPLS